MTETLRTGIEEAVEQGDAVLTPHNNEAIADSNVSKKNASRWSMKREEMGVPFYSGFGQTRTALIEGAVINMSVGIRLDQNDLNIVEVLELIDDKWQVVQSHPFELEKSYILARENSVSDFPDEVKFSSGRKRLGNGKKSLRFYVGNRLQQVLPVHFAEVIFPQRS